MGAEHIHSKMEKKGMGKKLKEVKKRDKKTSIGELDLCGCSEFHKLKQAFQFLKMKLGLDKAALLSYSIGQINASPSQIQDEGKIWECYLNGKTVKKSEAKFNVI